MISMKCVGALRVHLMMTTRMRPSNVSVCTRRDARYLGDRSRYSEANFA